MSNEEVEAKKKENSKFNPDDYLDDQLNDHYEECDEYQEVVKANNEKKKK